MAALIAFVLWALPAVSALVLHARLNEYRTERGAVARHGVGKWAAWREQLRPANYRTEGHRLLRWYTIALAGLQLAVLVDLVILARAYP